MQNFIVLDLNGNDITNKVVVYTGPSDPAYYRKLASVLFKKADKFYEEEIFSKRLELTNEEWFEKQAQYKEIMNIAGSYEDKELVSICKNIIHFLSEKSENPLKTKISLTVGFKELLSEIPEVAALV